MKTEPTEIFAIIAEAKTAGCENADQINGYLADQISRLRESLNCVEAIGRILERADAGKIKSEWYAMELIKAEVDRAMHGPPVLTPELARIISGRELRAVGFCRDAEDAARCGFIHSA